MRQAFRSLAWLATIGATAGCADAGATDEVGWLEESIVGGALVEPDEWPAVVSLGGCSGTLIHRRLVVYAAHCGTAIGEVRFGVDASAPAQVVATDHCQAYPGARLGDGTDLAYCVLGEDVLDVEPARVLAGCEQAELEPGREVELVGFGVDEEDGEYGLARSARATITDVGDELLISADAADTCKGDSGGPVFLPVSDDSGESALRLAAVTSAGTSPVCGQGVAHYVNLARKVDWLEESSGLDVTPCFDHGVWAPTPECLSESCGAAWQGQLDVEPPVVAFSVPQESRVERTLDGAESYYETPIEVVADDDGTGVERVTITLRDAHGTFLMQRVDEVPPYALSNLRLPLGAYVLEAMAQDFSQQSVTAQVEFEITDGTVAAPQTGGGCSATPRQRSHRGDGHLALLFGFLLRRRRRARLPQRH